MHSYSTVCKYIPVVVVIGGDGVLGTVVGSVGVVGDGVLGDVVGSVGFSVVVGGN